MLGHGTRDRRIVRLDRHRFKHLIVKYHRKDRRRIGETSKTAVKEPAAPAKPVAVSIDA